jgi:hypothetical protein
MSVLELAREAFARVRRERNGVPIKCRTGDKSDLSDQRPGGEVSSHGDEGDGGYIAPDYQDQDNPFRETP